MKYIFRKKYYLLLARLFDFVGYLFFKSFPLILRSPSSILIIRLDHLGDIWPATALSKILKENFPTAKVFFLTSSQGKALLENNPFVDEVFVYDAPWFSKKPGAGSKKLEGKIKNTFLDIAKILKDKKIDLGLSLRGDLRENFLLWLAKIPVRIGYGITGGGFFLTHEAHYKPNAHESQHTLDLLKTIGIDTKELKPHFYFTTDEEKFLASQYSARGINLGDNLVGFQIDAGTQAKEWPETHLQTFLNEFPKHFPQHRLILTGSRNHKSHAYPNNAPRHPECQRHEGSQTEILRPCGAQNDERVRHSDRREKSPVNFVGKTSLRELCFLMKHFKAFVGPDSGPTHIAAGLGIPTVFLYSGTNEFEQWKPLSDNAVALRHEVPCSPCALKVCNVEGHPCLSQITPEQVLKELEKILR